jgi:predicted GNAT family N-acyltransferase
MNDVRFRLIAHGSPAYREAVHLREEVLRKGLSLPFTAEELASEAEQLHVAGYREEMLCATCVLVPQGARFKMQRVAVIPHLQGKGIGSALLAFCENQVQKRGGASVYCHARDTAIAFYRKHGFTPIGEMFLEDTIPHLRMEKAL